MYYDDVVAYRAIEDVKWRRLEARPQSDPTVSERAERCCFNPRAGAPRWARWVLNLYPANSVKVTLSLENNDSNNSAHA